MCVGVYVFMWVCMYLMYVCTNISTFVCVVSYLCKCRYVCGSVCMCVLCILCMYVCM